MEGPRAPLANAAETMQLAERQGREGDARLACLEMILARCWLGDWDQALAEILEVIAPLKEAGEKSDLVAARATQALLFAWRGEAQRAEPFLAWIVDESRKSAMVRVSAWGLPAAAAVYLRLGEPGVAVGLLAERTTLPATVTTDSVALSPEAVRTALAAGDAEVAQRLADAVKPFVPLTCYARETADALLAEHHGEHERAAAAFAAAAHHWHDFEMPYEEAQALLDCGRCLVALGRRDQAASALRAARTVFTRLKARPALAETDALLAQI
jgi:hypothetical protein